MPDLKAFAELLKAARARINPADFPELTPVLSQRDARGRRGAGLTQPHMDALLKRTPTTYNRLECGHSIPKGLLEDVARILRLTSQEWDALWRFAFGEEAPSRMEGGLGLVFPAAWEAEVAACPFMAYITDYRWDLVCYNELFARMFTGSRVPGNTMRWMLTVPEARITLAEWRTCWAPALIAQLRAAVALHPEDPTLASLQAEVLADPVAGPIYAGQDTVPGGELAYVRPRADESRPLLHPTLGLGRVTMCASQIFGVPGSRRFSLIFEQGPAEPVRPPLQAPARRPARGLSACPMG